MMTGNLQLVATADGSYTVFNEAVGEHYHSRNGALQESMHVFVNAGLKYFLAQHEPGEISILEVGFGTGLNFLLTAEACTQRGVKLSYTGIEAFPLSHQLITQTGYDRYISARLWEQFTTGYEQSAKAANAQLQINGSVLTIAACPLLDFNADQQFDIIYFDAFAASRQPEMWNEEAINHTVRFLKPGGVFVTYAITGNLKRMLKALGLTIQKIPGAAGKREMLRGIKTTEL